MSAKYKKIQKVLKNFVILGYRNWYTIQISGLRISQLFFLGNEHLGNRLSYAIRWCVRCIENSECKLDLGNVNHIKMQIGADIPRSSHMKPQGLQSWTDDLPVCRKSGVGFSTNQIYREDGYREEEHEFEDRSFHIRLDDSTSLYGVFDGHNGAQAAKFAFQKMAAEILLGQLSGKSSDEEVREILRQAFIAVEKGYLESIDDRLAQRTGLRCEIPQGASPREAFRNFPQLVGVLESLDAEVSAGTTAVVALVYAGKLFVANVGDSRALLCRTDSNGVLRVVQLSVDHDLRNEDELLRLAQLGLGVDKIRQGSLMQSEGNTRCLGNYLVKGGYKESEDLLAASSDPVIAEPEIHGGIVLDESCRFLLLMSDGLYKSLEEATGSDQVNKDIAQMTVEQFRVQTTLTGVAQAVVDKIVRIHHDGYMSAVAPGSPASASGPLNFNKSPSVQYTKRDDITLLVVNFNFRMPNALRNASMSGISSSTPGLLKQVASVAPSSARSSSVHFNPIITSIPSANSYSSSSSSATTSSSTTHPGENDSNESEGAAANQESSSDTSSLEGQVVAPVDKNRRINAYVDFSEYYEKAKKACEEGKAPPGIRLL